MERSIHMTCTSLNTVKNYIDAIDFSKIIDKLVNYNGWLKEDATLTCQQYRNFLFLSKKYSDEKIQLPPSEDIDEFWHNHILDTEIYIKDCQAIFGGYWHHYPYFGIDDNSDMTTLNLAFEKTNSLYFNEFGHHIVSTKSRYPTFVYYLLKKLESKILNRSAK